jgi:hypothetical protein
MRLSGLMALIRHSSETHLGKGKALRETPIEECTVYF